MGFLLDEFPRYIVKAALGRWGELFEEALGRVERALEVTARACVDDSRRFLDASPGDHHLLAAQRIVVGISRPVGRHVTHGNGNNGGVLVRICDAAGPQPQLIEGQVAAWA